MSFLHEFRDLTLEQFWSDALEREFVDVMPPGRALMHSLFWGRHPLYARAQQAGLDLTYDDELDLERTLALVEWIKENWR